MVDEQVAADRGAEQDERQADEAEEIQRILRELGEQDQRRQIGRAVEVAGDPVLAGAEPALVVPHRDFADLRTAPRENRRDEPVLVAAQRQRLDAPAAVGLEAAVVVVQVDPRTLRTTQLNSFDGSRFSSGSLRFFFQPETRS